MESVIDQNPRPDKEWFRQQLARREISQRQLAALIGVDPATITYTLNGTRRLTLNELKQFSEILHLPVDEIMRHWGFPEVGLGRVKVPITGYMNDDCSVAEATQPCVPVEAPPGIPRDGRAIQIRSPHASVSIWDGMLCFVGAGNFNPTEAIGHMALCTDNQGVHYMGYLSRGYEDGKYNLTHPVRDNLRTDLDLTNAIPCHWFRAAR